VAFAVFLFLALVFVKPNSDKKIPLKNLPNQTSSDLSLGPVYLVAVGDISFSRSVERVVKAEKDFNYPFLKVKEFLNSGDIVFANLETPITPGREIRSGEMIFRSNPETALALRQAGFNILSLANNHTMNFGEKGLADTFNYLSQQGIEYVGAGWDEAQAYSAKILQVKGFKFAFLAYSDGSFTPASYGAKVGRFGIALLDEKKLVDSVRDVREKADFVIVSMHAGQEYTLEPNSLQINFAHKAVDAGADIVIGHHPHVVQRAEKYKGKYIFYSLGNFVFDQMWSDETRKGLAIKVEFNKSGIGKIFLFPIRIENFSQPNPMPLWAKGDIIERLNLTFEKEVFVL